MTTTVTQLGQTILPIRRATGAPSRDKDSSNFHRPQDRSTARFTLLADPKPRWGAFGASFLVQCFSATLLITLPMLFPERLLPKRVYDYIPLVAPPTAVPMPPAQPIRRVKVEPPPAPPIEPPRVAKLIAPPRPVVPKPRPKDIKVPEAPKVDPVFAAARMDVPRSEPARPRPPVETGMLTTGSAAPAKVNKPIQLVQTGGFGDPNGLPGPGDPNKRANIARLGSPDLPGGPGYGNGTGGANGVRGTVASAGFGNGVAIPPNGNGNGNGNGGRGTVRQTGFADATVAAEAPRTHVAAPARDLQPVEILSKPEPVYTEEARRLRLEGEVLVEAVFLASSEIRVVRVVRGLGHGLDEAALRAAQQIRFKPARRGGQAVDFPATVRIVFQMAY